MDPVQPSLPVIPMRSPAPSFESKIKSQIEKIKNDYPNDAKERSYKLISELKSGTEYLKASKIVKEFFPSSGSATVRIICQDYQVAEMSIEQFEALKRDSNTLSNLTSEMEVDTDSFGNNAIIIPAQKTTFDQLIQSLYPSDPEIKPSFDIDVVRLANYLDCHDFLQEQISSIREEIKQAQSEDLDKVLTLYAKLNQLESSLTEEVVNRELAEYFGKVLARARTGERQNILDKYLKAKVSALSFDNDNIDDNFLSDIGTINSLKYLKLQRCNKITDVGLLNLGNLRPTHLTLALCNNITDQALVHIKNFPLKSLNLAGSHKITDAGIAHISSIVTLTHLDLSLCSQITDLGLSHLSPLILLEYLKLESCDKVSDKGLEHLRNFIFLADLDLSSCNRITDEGMASLSIFERLAYLRINRCRLITDKGLAFISSLPLKYLGISDCKITDAGCLYISKMDKLSCLNLTRCEQITDDGIYHIRNLKKLTELALFSCVQITDAAIEFISDLNSLTWLGLQNSNKLTDVSFIYLKKLTSLNHLLILGCSELTGSGYSQLGEIVTLKKLDLSESKISDEALKSLSKLPLLTDLALCYCHEISDSGLIYIGQITTLVNLNLSGCDKITNPGLNALIGLNNLKSLTIPNKLF